MCVYIHLFIPSTWRLYAKHIGYYIARLDAPRVRRFKSYHNRSDLSIPYYQQAHRA
jgi:hypothetical protein